MRRSIMMGVVLAALAFTGCKKDKKTDDTAASGSAMTGSSMAGSGSTMAGSSMAGSGSSMAGSGSAAGSDMAGSGSAAGSDMAGSGSAAGSDMAGSGSSAAAGGGDPGCDKYAERFAACEKLDAKVKESMAKVFEGLKKAPTAKETCEKASKGWDTTLSKAGC
jgi:hypothetical protein